MKTDYKKYYHFKNKGWIWGILWPSLLYLGLSIIIGVIGGIIAGIYAAMHDINAMDIALSGTFNLSLNMVVQILTIAVCLPIYLYNRKHYYSKPKTKPSIKLIIFSICFVLLISVPLDYLLTYIKNNFLGETKLDLVNQLISDANIYITILSASILAPIVEELMLRGLTLNKALSRTNTITAILISSIIFGILHMNVIQGIFAFLIGIPLALVFIKTKSIIPCILCHLANNLIAVFQMDISSKGYLISNIVIIVITIIPAYLFIKGKEIDYN